MAFIPKVSVILMRKRGVSKKLINPGNVNSSVLQNRSAKRAFLIFISPVLLKKV